MTIQEVNNVLHPTNRAVWAILKIDFYGSNEWQVVCAARKYVTIRNSGRILKIEPSYISELVVK